MPDLGSATFSQTDASNNSGTMPSWSGSAAPSTLDDAGRALQGAITREWNWRNHTLTSGGSGNAQTLTYSVAPAAYYNGQKFAFIAGFSNTGGATLNVNSLGAKNLRKVVAGTLTALASGDLVAGAYVEVAYNTANDVFVWTNFDANAIKTGAVTSSGLTQATSRLLGRTTASAGAIEEISMGGGLNLASTTLSLNGPAFIAHKNGTDQTGVSDATATKVTFGTEVTDTNANYDTGNSRFTPTVAGYYLISARVLITGTNPAEPVIAIYKNGAAYAWGPQWTTDNGNATVGVNAIISMNGSTDYVEIYGYANVGSGTVTFGGDALFTQFEGCFLRGA